MAEKTVTIFKDMYFGLSYQYDKYPDMLEFKYHNHNDVYEIVLFLSGDAELCVEGNTYKLSPYDIAIVRPFEMHRIECLSGKPYERVLMYTTDEYCRKNNCESFLGIFKERSLGSDNLIPSDIVKSSGLLGAVNRMRQYCEDNAYTAANGVMTEFLYLLNNSKSMMHKSYAKDRRIREIIVFINENLTEDISLDSLSQQFFINKYHLCKAFKKNTGYTIIQYINHKRILLVQELHKGGQSLIQASSNAGFNNYSHFYKMYVNFMGESPKNML